MINSVKARTPILALILFVFAVGYTVAAKVVVIPLGADAATAPALPAGMVSTFNSKTCPTGWEEYTKAQDRFVRGLGSGTPGTQGGTNSHNHPWAYFQASARIWYSYDSNGAWLTMRDWENGMDTDGSGDYPLSTTNTAASKFYFTGTKDHIPRYVRLLYCEKV